MTAVELLAVLACQLVGHWIVYKILVARQYAQSLEFVRALSALNAALQEMHSGKVLPFKR